MNGQTAKLLRKISTLSGRSNKYIKNEYKKMSPDLQKNYLLFIKRAAEQIPLEPQGKEA